ncbi:MAG: hypothetical protein JWL62_3884, partial [Hyphomicrobiales bacterium]|nr:hypothetical protein [Hyphomicrobiales bacterium]
MRRQDQADPPPPVTLPIGRLIQLSAGFWATHNDAAFRADKMRWSLPLHGVDGERRKEQSQYKMARRRRPKRRQGPWRQKLRPSCFRSDIQLAIVVGTGEACRRIGEVARHRRATIPFRGCRNSRASKPMAISTRAFPYRTP